MKTLLLVSTLLASFTAHSEGVKYICKEKIKYGPKQTMILTQVSDRKIKEGVKEKFVLEVYQGYSKAPNIKAFGTVTTEDVMFEFTSDDKSISAMIYLDELEESGLTVVSKTTNFDCN